MKYPTLRFVFDRRKTATDTRKASIYLEVAFERKRRDVPTGVHVCANQWNDSKRVVARTDAQDLNTQLGAIESHVRKVLAAMLPFIKVSPINSWFKGLAQHFVSLLYYIHPIYTDRITQPM